MWFTRPLCEWSLLREYAFGADSPSAKQLRYRRAKDTTKLVLEPNIALVNEIAVLIRFYEKYRQPWHLQWLRSLLEEFALPAVADFLGSQKVCGSG